MKNFVALAIAGGAVGFIVGAWMFGPSPVEIPTLVTSPAGLAASLTTPSELSRREAAIVAFRSALRIDPDLRAFAELGSLMDTLDSESMGNLLEEFERDGLGFQVHWLLDAWMERDPSAVAAWIRPKLDRAAQDGAVSFRAFPSTLSPYLEMWISRNPQEALEYARAHPNAGLSIAIVETLNAKNVGVDESASVKLLCTFRASSAQRNAVQSILTKWAARNAAAALAAAQSLPGGFVRDEAIGAVLLKWSERDAASAFQQYQSSAIHEPAVLSEIVSSALNKNRDEALEFLDQLSPVDFENVSPRLVAAWAKKEPINALSWALENHVPLSESHTFESQILPRELSRVTTTGSSLTISPVAEALTTDTQSTLDWIRSLPDEADRHRLLALAIDSAPTDNIDSRLNELAPEDAVSAAARLAQRVAFLGEIESSDAWVESLPPGLVRAAAWRGVGAQAMEPPTLPPGPDRDAMLHGRALGIGIHNGVSSNLDLVLQIGDETLRRDAFDLVMDRCTSARGAKWWGDEARAWLEQANIPEEWKQPWRR